MSPPSGRELAEISPSRRHGGGRAVATSPGSGRPRTGRHDTKGSAPQSDPPADGRAATTGRGCEHPECGERCDYEPIPKAVLLAWTGACGHPECFWTHRMGSCGLAHDPSPDSGGSGGDDRLHHAALITHKEEEDG